MDYNHMLCTGDNGSVPSRTQGCLHLLYFTHSWFLETALLAVCQETFVTRNVCRIATSLAFFLSPWLVEDWLWGKNEVCLLLSALAWSSWSALSGSQVLLSDLVDTQGYSQIVYLSVAVTV